MMRMILMMVVTGWMAGGAWGQVVLDMPAPPRDQQPLTVTTDDGQVSTVEVGDVALYRYGSARFHPRSTLPTYYYRTYYPSYHHHFLGFGGYGLVGRHFFYVRPKFHRSGGKGFRHRFKSRK